MCNGLSKNESREHLIFHYYSRALEPQAIYKIAKKTWEGIRLMSQTKHVIENVRLFFEKRKVSSLKRERIIEHTAEVTGVSVRKVHNIIINIFLKTV